MNNCFYKMCVGCCIVSIFFTFYMGYGQSVYKIAVPYLVIGGSFQPLPGPHGANRPPLHDAIINRDLATVKKLVEQQGCNINSLQSNNTPLHLASGRGYEEIVRYLLQKGADVNAVDNSGQTPLHVAAAGAREGVVKMLIGAGANIIALDADHKIPADLAAHSVIPWAYAKIVSERVVDYLNKRALSSQMLLLGVRLNNLALVTSALKDHADISIRDKKGNTPLHLAVLLGYPEIVKYLLQFVPPKLIRNIRNNDGLSVIDCAVTVPGMMEIFKARITGAI